MTMQCKHCGGVVVWKGPLTALTHTECTRCGATNSQVAEPDAEDQRYDFEDEMASTVAQAFAERTQSAIRALLADHTSAVAQFAVHMHKRVKRAEAVADALSQAIEGKAYEVEVARNQITVGNAEALLKALNTYRNHRGT